MCCRMLASQATVKMSAGQATGKILAGQTTDKMSADRATSKIFAGQSTGKMSADRASGKMFADQATGKMSADQANHKMSAGPSCVIKFVGLTFAISNNGKDFVILVRLDRSNMFSTTHCFRFFVS